ncbi:MAG: DUF4127 family protein [Lachnospiraceae bacterium]|nr:DUF4127 family protein [Lachnospiraceae bacterium]
MKKIVLLSLDERPCNYDFPYKLFQSDEIKIVRPDRLGSKKTPADTELIKAFLRKECESAYGVILSVDMLLYGGLIPSRIHQEDEETLKKRLRIIRELKQKNPQLKVYAFQCIMRCPNYNGDDEEPDYYAAYGKKIFEEGVLKHKYRLAMAEEKELQQVRMEIPSEVLIDYEKRREINRNLNMETIGYYKAGYIDTLVFPQDDSAPYGYTAMDQMTIRRRIQKDCLTDEILIYSGADEVALTLASRMINKMKESSPKVYVKYAAEAAKYMIPLYEGVRLGTTIGYHILSAGCVQVETDDKADTILVITAPDDRMEEAVTQPSIRPNYNAERNMPEMIRYILRQMEAGKRIAIADNAYANGGELDLIRILDKHQILMKVCAYAGWNTNGNTLGTTLAQAVYDYHYGDTRQRRNFLVERFIEDVGYCGLVRSKVTNQITKMGLGYFDAGGEDGIVAEMVKKELYAFIKEYLPSIVDQVEITHVSMPWRRMFEIRVNADIDHR